MTLSVSPSYDHSLALTGSPALDPFALLISPTPLLTQLGAHGPSFGSILASDLNCVSHLPCKLLNVSDCPFSPSLHQSGPAWQEEEGSQ